MLLRRDEWDAILVSKDVHARLDEIQADGVLESVFPSLQSLVGFGGGDTGHKCLWSHTKQVVRQTVPEPLLRWAALFHDVGKPLAFDWKGGKITFHHHEAVSARVFRKEARGSRLFTPEETRQITFIVGHLGHVEAYYSDWSDSAVRRLDRQLGTYLDSVFAVARADCTTGNPAKRRKQLRRTSELRRRIEDLRAQDAVPPALPKGLGDALMTHLGLEAGPELGKVMRGLRDRVEAGELPRNAPIEVYLSTTTRA